MNRLYDVTKSCVSVSCLNLDVQYLSINRLCTYRRFFTATALHYGISFVTEIYQKAHSIHSQLLNYIFEGQAEQQIGMTTFVAVEPLQNRAEFSLHKIISLLSLFKSRATLNPARFANLERRHSVSNCFAFFWK